MKMRVQAQHLQIGDIVGSGESINNIIISSTKWPSSKVYVELLDDAGLRSAYWGKTTLINVERVKTDIIDLKQTDEEPIKSHLRRFGL